MIWVYGFLLACTTDTSDVEEHKIDPKPVQTKKEMVIKSTELRVFEMQDGTKVTGVLIGTDGEAFKVRSKSLGMVRIPMNELKKMNPLNEDVADEKKQSKPTLLEHPLMKTLLSTPTISSDWEGQPALSPNPMNPQIIKTIQDTMMGDPEIMGMLYTLQNNPQLMRALQDPEIFQLIQTGDMEAINNHPTFKMLESNEQIRDILNRMR